ncbi:hypothetical protein [Nostoc spongiaeforme]|nr:hypothetical protein [Nostoc spongiaeforme]
MLSKNSALVNQMFFFAPLRETNSYSQSATPKILTLHSAPAPTR